MGYPTDKRRLAAPTVDDKTNNAHEGSGIWMQEPIWVMGPSINWESKGSDWGGLQRRYAAERQSAIVEYRCRSILMKLNHGQTPSQR
ncbi:hypothetical protein M2275_007781 [Rhodococcus opacus]|nr:hypothetical protein [Rhodococcus opacus]